MINKTRPYPSQYVSFCCGRLSMIPIYIAFKQKKKHPKDGIVYKRREENKPQNVALTPYIC